MIELMFLDTIRCSNLLSSTDFLNPARWAVLFAHALLVSSIWALGLRRAEAWVISAAVVRQ
jgi:hypothetical protein